ncbi:hypothetical protein P153DRAFT_434015 [Dothidotthia symphoricarpi CBS 119687]|uniref:Uncharacterized protein n=1 Tax=Dothidotthia symphoricarpi CBS 119687 TaxID=1392245 RepID=A0A6A6A4Y8_9PLEO|nr:uncharacterized protein P153DRAFT_434015 [Dothidotthia symphoricarpi CBS 119687]KAF2126235.1 hypothetical protein P153DRAFT_434015 [Dothidotthia symphoricarpi CBS 119687]
MPTPEEVLDASSDLNAPSHNATPAGAPSALVEAGPVSREDDAGEDDAGEDDAREDHAEEDDAEEDDAGEDDAAPSYDAVAGDRPPSYRWTLMHGFAQRVSAVVAKHHEVAIYELVLERQQLVAWYHDPLRLPDAETLRLSLKLWSGLLDVFELQFGKYGLKLVEAGYKKLGLPYDDPPFNFTSRRE